MNTGQRGSKHRQRSMASRTRLLGLYTRTRVLTDLTRQSPRSIATQRSLPQPQSQKSFIRPGSTSTSTSTAKSPRSLPLITMANKEEYILTLSCPDRPGIVHAVTGFLAQHNLNIVDSQQFGDPTSKRFFMRVHFAPAEPKATEVFNADQLRSYFDGTAKGMAMDFELSSVSHKPRVMIMVSKIGHCLNDLLYKQSIAQLAIEIPLIVSNHPDFAPLAKTYDIPFHHLPITAETKAEQENRILELAKENNIDLIVLARYVSNIFSSLQLCCRGTEALETYFQEL